MSGPGIERDQYGSYVFRSVKFFCQAPTNFNAKTELRQDGILIREWTTTGVSGTPYHFKYEGPCYNTTTHTFSFNYKVWLYNATNGTYRSGGSANVRLPCLLG